MQNFIDLVKTRYSCRDYKDTPVKKEDIQLCLESARLAPSACNSQPWKFIVIDDPARKNEICDKIFTGPYKTNSFAKKAPVLIIVLSKKSNFTASVGSLMRDTRYYLIDIGVAVEHFVLQAADLGLSTCWMGWFDENALKKALKLPGSSKVDIVLPLGYSNKDKAPEKIRKKIEETAEFNP